MDDLSGKSREKPGIKNRLLTVTQVSHRVSDTFQTANRVFLAGDGVHTHSPKAGQRKTSSRTLNTLKVLIHGSGMNVSTQDSYNLDWKIALVVKGLANPAILDTYESERKPIAEKLIAFDYQYSRLFSRQPTDDLVAVASPISSTDSRSLFEQATLFTSGLSVDYGPSILVAKPKKAIGESEEGTRDALSGPFDIRQARTINIGMRFPSHQVLNLSDARPVQFGHLLKSDCKFRIIFFAGNVKDARQRQRIEDFCSVLASPRSPIRRFASAIELLTIYSG